MSKRYSCVLFDVDNTLADTTPIVRAALQECGCPNVDGISDEEIRSIAPTTILSGRGCGGMNDEYWRVYEKVLVGRVHLLDDQTPEVLLALKSRNVLLGVVTSCRLSTTRVVLRHCGIFQFLEPCLVTYGTCRRRKPHPDPIQRGLDMLGAVAETAMYIGDSEKDAQASRAAGVAFGLPGWARLPDLAKDILMPDVVLRRIADLLGCT